MVEKLLPRIEFLSQCRRIHGSKKSSDDAKNVCTIFRRAKLCSELARPFLPHRVSIVCCHACVILFAAYAIERPSSCPHDFFSLPPQALSGSADYRLSLNAAPRRSPGGHRAIAALLHFFRAPGRALGLAPHRRAMRSVRSALPLLLLAALCRRGASQTVIAAWAMSSGVAATSGAAAAASSDACCGKGGCPLATGTSCGAAPCCYFNALGWVSANGWNSATNGGQFQYLQFCTATKGYAAPITLTVKVSNPQSLASIAGSGLKVYWVASSGAAMTSLAPAGAVSFSPGVSGGASFTTTSATLPAAAADQPVMCARIFDSTSESTGTRNINFGSASISGVALSPTPTASQSASASASSSASATSSVTTSRSRTASASRSRTPSPSPCIPAAVVTTLAGGGCAGCTTAGSADGAGSTATFSGPTGVAVVGGITAYVAEFYGHRIRAIDIDAAAVSTLAGSGAAGSADGVGVTASFYNPFRIAFDGGAYLYVADFGNHRIRTILVATRVVMTLAGRSAGYADGVGTNAAFFHPTSVAADGAGNVYVADNSNGLIRAIAVATAVVTTLAGGGSAGDGAGSAATFNFPHGVVVDAARRVFVAEYSNNLIRVIAVANKTVDTFAGGAGGTMAGRTDGVGRAGMFNNPVDVTIDTASSMLYVADLSNNLIRAISVATAAVTTLAGGGAVGGVAAGSADGAGSAATFSGPYGVAASTAGRIFVADVNNNLVRVITQQTCQSTSGSSFASPSPSPSRSSSPTRSPSPSGSASPMASPTIWRWPSCLARPT